MRINDIRKGRECIIPDISRTYHFGASGVNMNPYFQDHYFKKHTLNRVTEVELTDVERSVLISTVLPRHLGPRTLNTHLVQMWGCK